MTNKTLDLSLEDDGAFPAIDEAAWKALVKETLKGADFEKRLVKKTADGIPVAPLYDAEGAAPFGGGEPGVLPFTRGTKPALDPERPWHISLRVDHPDLKKANAIILEGLENGVSHLDLILADHTRGGLVLEELEDLEALLKGVDLALIKVSVSGGEGSVEVAGKIARLGGPKTVQGCIGYDPLGGLARTGGLTKPLEDAMAYGGLCAKQTSAMTDKFRSFNVDLRPYDAAGATPALSLGVAMATGLAYLKAGVEGGLSVDDAARQIIFTLTTDTDLFGSIAKLRAARTLWSRVVTASGGSAEAAAMHLHVETASSIMTAYDVHTNLLRTAIAGFGAGVAGADAISILPFTAALGLPDELARRMARNIHMLLAEESSLGRVADPAGGSYALEHLTRDLAKAGWAAFQAIEGEGGMGAALTSGRVKARVEASLAERRKAIATRKIPLTGVSEFPDLSEAPVDLEEAPAQSIPAPTYAVTAPALMPERLAAPFEALRARAEKAAPTLFLANIGRLVDFNARAQFAQNAFEAGGIKALPGEGFEGAEACARAFQASGAPIACLCSSDALYTENAESFARALVEAGAKKVYLAGNPGEAKAAYEAAGITGFVYMGADLLAALEDALTASGV